MSNNGIVTILEAKFLKELEDFWVCYRYPNYSLFQANDNKIASWSEVDSLAHLPTLSTVYLERNPIYYDSAYRRRVMLALPQVTQIDAIVCRSA